MTIRPRWSTVSPPTVRHLAPTSVENIMQIVRIENRSQIGAVASNGYLVKRAYWQDRFLNPFKIFFHKTCKLVRSKFEINFIKFRKHFINHIPPGFYKNHFSFQKSLFICLTYFRKIQWLSHITEIHKSYSIWILISYTSLTVLSMHSHLLLNSNSRLSTLGAKSSKLSKFYPSVKIVI